MTLFQMNFDSDGSDVVVSTSAAWKRDRTVLELIIHEKYKKVCHLCKILLILTRPYKGGFWYHRIMVDIVVLCSVTVTFFYDFHIWNLKNYFHHGLSLQDIGPIELGRPAYRYS